MLPPASSNRFALLAEASMAIERGLDLDETLHAIVDAARSVTGARYAALGVLGPGRRIARFVTSGLDEEAIERIGPPPTGRGILGVVIDEGRPLRLADLTAEPRSAGFPAGHPEMRSFLGVPLQARGEAFGNLYLTEAPGGAFSDEDEALVTVLATKAGIAIENARLYADTRRQADAARRSADARASVQKVAASILRERDVGRVLMSLAAEAQRLVQAGTVAIGVPDEISRTVRFPVAIGDEALVMRGREIPLDGSLSGTVLQAGVAMRIDDATVSDAVHRTTLDELGARTLMSVPMMSGEEAIAVISVIERAGGEPFTAADQETIESLATLGAIALQTARAFGRERARGEALVRLRQAEAEAAARRTALLRVVDVQEQERRRIAQDLHDRAAGSLAAIQMSLKSLEREQDRDVLMAGIREARSDLAGAIEELRDLIVDLRPKVLDDFGLAPALERICATFERRTGLAVDVAADPAVNGVSPGLASTAYRIVQETLTNAARHAQATTVRVSAAVEAGTLIIVIEDDGVGLDPGRTAAGGFSYGIAGMRERADLAAGSLEFQTPTGGGTRVLFEAPL